MKGAKVQSRGKHGFTLIELLVVISIIALLLAILVPALRKAKELAQMVAGKNQQKQIALGLSIYCSEHDNKALVGEGGVDFWFIQIAPYIGDRGFAKEAGLDAEEKVQSTMALLKCPATKSPVKKWDPSQSIGANACWGNAEHQWRYHAQTRVEGAYALNAFVGGWEGNGQFDEGTEYYAKSYRQAAVTDPAVPVIADAIWVDARPEPEDPVPDDLYTGYSYGLGRYCTNRHGDQTNVVFADTHAETIDLEQLWTLKWHRQWEPQYDVKVPAR